MKKFTRLNGLVGPINIANVDTDMIIPKQFLKSIKRHGFGKYLFDRLRYLDEGEPDMACENRPLNKEFVLNQPRYQGCSVLLAKENFGCGSSREHAPWALEDFGIRCVIAPSFADIFYNNCFKNGILPIILDAGVVEQLFTEVAETEGYKLDVDLVGQKVTTPSGECFGFSVDKFRKQRLINGLDDIGVTLNDAADIKAFEQKAKQETPWLFADLS